MRRKAIPEEWERIRYLTLLIGSCLFLRPGIRGCWGPFSPIHTFSAILISLPHTHQHLIIKMAHDLLSNPYNKDNFKDTVNGSCLCSAITFTLAGTSSTTVLCHCLSCKKSSGSAFQANGFYEISVLNSYFPHFRVPY